MVELLLMRHAKSDWHVNVSDIDRPLNKRGRKDAELMGRYLLTNNLVPDRVLVSPARRAQETLAFMNQSWQLDSSYIITDKELYLADEDTLLENAAVYAGDGKRIMLLAHNPGMDYAVSKIAKKMPERTESGKLMVTAAVAYFKAKKAADLEKMESCELISLFRPKELDI